MIKELFKPLFQNRVYLVFGIANEDSIAYSIAKKLDENGSKLVIAYQKRVEDEVKKCCKLFKDVLFVSCDVLDDESLNNLALQIKKKFKKINGLVHSIAFAKKEDLEGNLLNTKQENYNLAQDVSSYSLIKICNKVQHLFSKDASIITMTFQGSQRVVQNYNLMGICKASLEASVKYLAYELGSRGLRVNAISAGPIKTQAASAIKGFDIILDDFKKRSCLKRDLKTNEIANSAVFLLSELSSAITGQIIYVDLGYGNICLAVEK